MHREKVRAAEIFESVLFFIFILLLNSIINPDYIINTNQTQDNNSWGTANNIDVACVYFFTNAKGLST